MRNKKLIHNSSAKKIDTAYIDQLAGTAGPSERIAALNWVTTQIEETKIDVFATFARLVREKRVPGEPVSAEFLYSMFLSASKSVRKDEEKMSLKRAISEAEGEELDTKRMAGFKRPKKTKGAKKFMQVKKNFLGIIKKLIEDHHYSWREVSQYLCTYHGLNATHSYIRQAYYKAMAEISPEVIDEAKLS